MSVKRISQETFDAAVLENIEDFGQSPGDALRDATNQFLKQGIDISNLDTSGGIGKAEFLTEVKKVIDYRDGASEITNEALLAAFIAIKQMCDDKAEFGKRNQNLLIAGKVDRGFEAIHDIMSEAQPAAILVGALDLLGALSKANVEIRDLFEPVGSQKLASILEFQAESGYADSSVCRAALNLAKIVSKSEDNKFMLGERGFKIIVSNILASPRIDAEVLDVDWMTIFQAACTCLKGLCTHDDSRREMSCAYENSRHFLNAAGVVGALMKGAARFVECPNLASAALYAAKGLITTEESVKIMSQNGAMKLPKEILSHENASIELVRSLLGVMRNLCADDIRKEKLAYDGSLERVVFVLSQDKYRDDFQLTDNGLACLAQFTLRSPSISERIVGLGAVDIICKCMRSHEERQSLLRQGCLTIRNIAGRCPELRGSLLDSGVEAVLRSAGKYQDCVDEAYGALRDLGCEVQRVKISIDGSVESAYEQFGQRKTSFRPVFEGSDELESNIVTESRAPFSKSDVSPFANTERLDNEVGDIGAGTGAGAGAGHDHSHSHEHDDHAHDHDHDGACCSDH